jgi:hypothetical protein
MIEIILILLSPLLFALLAIFGVVIVGGTLFIGEEPKDHVWVCVYNGELEVRKGPPHRYDILYYEDLGPL